MNFTLDACVATLILTVSLTCFIQSLLMALPTEQQHYDDSLMILGRLLRHYDLQMAIYSNNSALVDSIVYSAIHHLHDYYLVVVSPETNTIILMCGTPRLSSYLVSVTIPGWNGTLRPRTLCFRVGVKG